MRLPLGTTRALAPGMRASIIFLFASLLTSTASVAHAEAPPSCEASFVPSNDRPIPSNAPALVALSRSLQVTGVTVDHSIPDLPGTFEVVEDPRVARARLLIPSKPFASEISYSMSITPTCSAGTAFSQARNGVAFKLRTTKSVELPKAIGSAAARLAESGDPYTHLDVQPTAELAAYLPLTMVELFVDGERWALFPYGVFGNGGSGAAIRTTISAQSVAGVVAERHLCNQGETGVKTKDVDIRVHVAGATEDPPPITLPNVPFDCSFFSNKGTWRGSPNDAGADDPGAIAPAATAPLVGCACDAAGRGGGSDGWSFISATVAIAALALRGRKQRVAS